MKAGESHYSSAFILLPVITTLEAEDCRPRLSAARGFQPSAHQEQGWKPQSIDRPGGPCSVPELRSRQIGRSISL